MGRSVAQEVDESRLFPAHCGRPGEWKLTPEGLPVFIARMRDTKFGPWAFIRPPEYVAAEPALPNGLQRSVGAMPRIPKGTVRQLIEALVGTPPTRLTQVGRAGLAKEQPDAVRLAAWLSLREQNDREIARALRFVQPNLDDGAIAPPTLKKAKRYVAAGQRLLREEGVLPWFLWDDGNLPQLWLSTRLFSESLAYWYRFYIESMRDIFPHVEALVHKVGVRRAAALADPEGAFRLALDGLFPGAVIDVVPGCEGPSRIG